MAYGIQNLRRSAIFDQLTPGSGGGNNYMEEESVPTQQQTYEPSDTRILGPDGSPLDDRGEEPTSSGLAKLANLNVDPNKGTETERLKGYLDTIQGAYAPNYRSRDRNDELLDNFPTRGQPTKMDRFSAMMMSVGQKDALDITEKTLQAPYYRDRADWVAKSEPFYKAAQLENVDNGNTRQVIGTAANTFNQGERVRQQTEAANQRYDLGQQKLQIERFKADHPDWEIDLKGPVGWAIDPQNPNNRINLGPTGHMSDLDKLTIQGNTARDVAGIRNQGQLGAAQIRANASGGSGGASGGSTLDRKSVV